MGSLILLIIAIWLAFFFFTVPGPFIAGAAALYVAGALVVAYFQEFGRAMGLGPNPAAAAPEQPPPRRTEDGKEPAYRQYLFGQARHDLRHAHGLVWPRLAALGRNHRRWVKNTFFGYGAMDWHWPVGVVLMVGLFAGTILGLAVISLVATAQGVVLLAVFLLAFLGIYLLRGIDTVLLWIRGVRITCPSCYRRGFYPSYECRNCTVRHHDVRPGRYGVVRRVCACGERLPTLLLLGSHRMNAFCAHCEAPLAESVGTAAEVVLPVFGAAGAGKTRLMIVIMMAVEAIAGRSGATLALADEDTRKWDAQARRELIRSDKVAKTGIRLPRAYSLYVEPRRGGRRLVHVFDPAGEYFNESDRLQELQFLTLARTFLFVVDPLSVDALWARLDRADQNRYSGVRARREPEFVFAQTVQNLEAMGVRTKKARLVVVVSKRDLVSRILIEDGVEDGEEALVRWLDENLHQGNMLRSMRHAFGEVQFFLTTSIISDDSRVDDSIEKLTSWTLARQGLRLSG
ncbi:conserved hypothetical protein [Parafrankia sp. EAN1pec]|uniref:TRAFAC clade GTPase domain-containing protein n=1 Tax=Parafrankia sp. (strain EAN1pec) TaxID=298653 RepID=UPI0000541B55|nr:conserved hypothetical protein [Frankia sp. EAN1pec]